MTAMPYALRTSVSLLITIPKFTQNLCSDSLILHKCSNKCLAHCFYSLQFSAVKALERNQKHFQNEALVILSVKIPKFSSDLSTLL